MKRVSTARALVALTAGMLLSGAVSALENVGGQIANVYIAGGGNYGYRVNLVGNVPACSNGSGFGYVNDTDSNYKVFVANLMMAYAAKKTVSLITEKVNGFCHIVEVWVYD
ncbi:MAG TPA: hypothetical protein VLA61_21380 [Ideonella sp.]|uniref:hypothetical protein n=1 Tax=Ideonella sp. TaxID=1929293 RepID=UPI002C917FBB|nr:hypothetical protein [Ideonella sp.]HSI50827.1 hypothetical protein [Ideonella sp.]